MDLTYFLVVLFLVGAGIWGWYNYLILNKKNKSGYNLLKEKCQAENLQLKGEVKRLNYILNEYKHKFLNKNTEQIFSKIQPETTLTSNLSDENLRDLLQDKHELEKEKEKFQEKTKKLWEQSMAIHKEKERIDGMRLEIERIHKHLTDSIEYASRIQTALLHSTEEIAEVAPDSFILYKPRDIVSGDFFWFRKMEVFTNKYNVFTVADCTGHGVPGAFMSMLGISFLNEIVTEFYTELDVAEVLNRLRDEIKNHLKQKEGVKTIKDGMDIAICAVDYEQMKFQFAGANNPLYIIRYNDGNYSTEIEIIDPDRMPVGIYPKELPSFTKHELSFNRGDLVYLFSDGIVDQFGGKNGDKFLKRRVKEMFLQVTHLPMNEQKDYINQTICEWMGERYRQIDDITVVGVKL